MHTKQLELDPVGLTKSHQNPNSTHFNKNNQAPFTKISFNIGLLKYITNYIYLQKKSECAWESNPPHTRLSEPLIYLEWIRSIATGMDNRVVKKPAMIHFMQCKWQIQSIAILAQREFDARVGKEFFGSGIELDHMILVVGAQTHRK